MEVIVVRNEATLIDRLWSTIEKVANQAISTNNAFRIGLSGGSLIKYLAAGAEKCDTDWSKWRLFFCDERYVNETNEDSTFGQYKALFIPKTKLSESQFVTIDLDKNLDECAKAYEEKIYQEFGSRDTVPVFDLLLLGMGPDGHTCSLFPNHALLAKVDALVAPISDSPKPPPERVTMTYPLLNNAKMCLFALSGAGKAEMVKVSRFQSKMIIQ